MLYVAMAVNQYCGGQGEYIVLLCHGLLFLCVNGFDETLHSAVQLSKYANLSGAGSTGTAMEIEEPGFA
jgi:hypothetical protein